MRSLLMIVLLASVIAGGCIHPQRSAAQQVTVSFQLFYDELSPHGMWVEYPNYGYVWIPGSAPGFSPYSSDGHWVYTEDGWMWVSDYSWGWATFHYGRWGYDDMYGWFWVPDVEWGPAWVSWRRSPGYYGWTPLRPGISITVALGGGYREQDERWIFVREGDINRSDISRRYVNRNRNASIIRSSTPIRNTRKDNRRNGTYIAGPERDDVQKVTRAPVRPVVIRDHQKPGQRLSEGEVHVYRPSVEKRGNEGRAPVPSKVTKLKDARRPSDQNSKDRNQRAQPTKKKSGKDKKEGDS